jgi:hypothetical protein
VTELVENLPNNDVSVRFVFPPVHAGTICLISLYKLRIFLFQAYDKLVKYFFDKLKFFLKKTICDCQL